MRLHINIDHVATIRNARNTTYPDPCRAALMAERAGADGITAHLREDRRHIRDLDMSHLRQSVSTRLNMEMAATAEMADIAKRLHPDVITLVPERRDEQTTEGGLDVIAHYDTIEAVAKMCRANGIKLSTFIECRDEQIRASRELGAAQVELHTGEYANLDGSGQASELERIRAAARFAHAQTLEVAAGHGLTCENLVPIAAIAQIVELNIGHSVIASAIFIGIDAAVQQFREAIQVGRANI